MEMWGTVIGDTYMAAMSGFSARHLGTSPVVPTPSARHNNIMESRQIDKDDGLPPAASLCLKATGTIWGCATGMLGISIPLSAITHSAIIPVMVVAGASVATGTVWAFAPRLIRSPPRKTGADEQQVAALQQQLADMEERLANVETLNHFDRHLAEKQLAEANANASQQRQPERVLTQ